MKLAEGYGIVVLERADDAHRRGKIPLATILGYGESADAHHLTQPHPQGEGAARAMNAALASSGLTPHDIDMIAAHATGTPDNDSGECAALSRVFGADLPRVPVVAFKSHLGHTLGGAGAVELILSALCLRDQIVPACANVKADDLEFPGLNVSTGSSRPAILRATLNTSLGFGGANTCMILGPRIGRTDAIQPGPRPWADVFISGVGVVLPGMVGNEAFIRGMTAAEPRRVTRDTGPIPESDFADLLNARRVRRMSDYVKLSLAATMLACRDAGIADIPSFAATCSALLGSTHGSANYSEAYYRQIVTEGISAANPMLFAEGVPNAAAAHLSLMLSLKGPCQTVIGTRTAGLDALHLAATRIASGEWDRAIVSAGRIFPPGQCRLRPLEPLLRRHRPGPALLDPTRRVRRRLRGDHLRAGKRRSLDQRRAKPRGRVIHSSGPMPIPRRLSSLRNMLRVPDAVGHIITSANGTWLDRLESAALGRCPGKVITSMAGRIAETYSVTPLAGIAAVLLTGAVPTGAGLLRDAGSDTGGEPKQVEQVMAMASDYTGILSAAIVAVEPIALPALR